jgi:hypothetical protein
MSVDDLRAAKSGSGMRWLVRFFALIGFLGIVAIIFLAFGLYQFGRPYQPAKVAGAAREDMFTLRNVNELHGTNFLQLDIAVSERGSGSAYGSGRGEDTRNILLLDKVTGTSRKLLPDNNRRIDDTRYLSAEGDLFTADRGDLDALAGGEEEKRPPVAYYLVTVRQAADQNLEDVLVGTLKTGGQAYVMRGIDGIDSVWMHSPTQIGMIVRERLNLYHRIVDVPSLKVVRSTRIAVD